MTADPRDCAREVLETPSAPACSSDVEFFTHVDGLELAARAMIEAGRAPDRNTSARSLAGQCSTRKLSRLAPARTSVGAD